MMMVPRGRYFDIFDDLFEEPFLEEKKARKNNLMMKTDIKEEGKNYIMDIDMPGIDKENIKIELNDGYLTVSSEVNNNKEENNNGYIHKERYTGKFARSYYVGKNITEEDVEASYKNGTLSLVFPKEKEEVKEEKKLIAIK